jgi:integrase
MKKRKRQSIRLGAYVASEKRAEVRDGVQMTYWTIRCRRKGETFEKKLGWFPNKKSADRAAHRWFIKHVGANPKPNGKTKVTEVIDAYLKSVESMLDKRPATRLNRSYVAEQLRRFIQEHDSDTVMSEFQDNKYRAYLLWLQQQGLSSQTVLNAISGGRVFLRWARDGGFVDSIPKAPKVRVEAKAARRVEVNEYEQIRENAPGRLDLLVWVLWETGMRINEVLSLRKDRLDPSGPFLKVAALVEADTGFDFRPKTEQSERKVPVSPQLFDALMAEAKKDDMRIFASGTQFDYAHWRQRLIKVTDALGIRRIKFSEFRDTRARDLIGSNVPIYTYQATMGHSAKTALTHYTRATDDDLRDGFKQVQAKRMNRKAETNGDDSE